MTDSRPDLVLVMTDQHRHDQVGWFPGSPVRTPTLDRLAADGVVFDACYSSSTTCVPARTSLLTGRLDHRVATGTNRALVPGTPTVARMLRDAGYQTALVGKMHFTPMRADHGFDHLEVAEHFTAYPGDPASWDGYDHYHDWLAERGLPDWRFEVPGGTAAPYPFPPDTHPTAWVRDRAVEVLARRDPARPLLLVVSFPHPHPPLNPPEPYASLYDPADSAVDPDDAHRNDGLPHLFRLELEADGPDHRRVRAERLDHHRRELALTHGSITQIDDAVATVVDHLDLDRTLVWFTADHGDYGGRRGLVRKVPWIPFDDLARVPCFATGGPVSGGRRIASPVQSYDWVPTALAAAGLTMPYPDADPGDGQSQLGLLTGPAATGDDDRVVLSAFTMHWPMARRGRFKYIRELGWSEEVLFDLEADPDETTNLAGRPEAEEVRAELSAAVDEELSGSTIRADLDAALAAAMANQPEAPRA